MVINKPDRICESCGGLLRFAGHSPSGNEEWFHVESMKILEQNYS